jgi:VCBS repeat-containing protein
MRFDDQAMGGEAPRNSGDDETSVARVQLAMNLAQPPASVPVSANAVRVMPSPDGIITLPPGASLDSVRVVGRDLVVTLPDGTQWIIVDGAIFVPQLVINNVQIPPANLAALLIGQEPQPAAGPPQSSGGNFAIPVGGIGDPFDLGDLLPPTDLSFGTPQREEVYYPFPDDEPDVIVITPDNPAGAESASASVSEAGLPARGNEPPGSNAAANSETTTGSIVITSGDPPFTVTINGVAVTAVGQTFTTPFGDLTITSISNGAIGYSYTLRDNTSGDNTSDIFAITVTDADGDTAAGSLTINIIDDVPTARADTDSVAPGSSVTTGNVITGAGTDSGTAGADTQGADGASLTGVRVGASGNFTSVGAAGATIVGQFGTLTILPNGNYTYTKNANVPGGSADVFTYQLTDGDGDTSSATLTITNPDNPVSLAVPEAGAPGTIVFEAGLPAGSDPTADSEITSGTITFNAPDAPATVTVNGVAVTSVGQVIQVPGGTFTVTSITAGSIGYTYTLGNNFLTDPAQVSIPVSVTDVDGDSASATLVIDIIDDVPTARDDSASPAEDMAVVINVFANDTSGADGVNLATGVALGSAPTKGSVVYNGDGTFTYTPTPGEEGTDSFTYTITDGDGDVSTATVTITLAADSTPTIDVGAANSVAEAGLSFGSDPTADSEFATGSFTITTGNDTVGSLVINGTDVTNGGTVAGAFGTLTVTFAGGVYSYSYELTVNTSGDATSDSFSVVVTDSDGDVASDTLVIDIIDDVPTARDDSDSVKEDGPLTADGNVLGNDTAGADGASVTAIAFGATPGTVGSSLAGAYGSLTLNADGSYSYVLDNGNTIVQALADGESLTETFTYTITDGDGDTSTATLTITIDGTNDGVTINGLDAAGAELVVNEDDLADGSSPNAPALTQTGSFGIETPDGLGDVTVGGVTVVSNGVFTPGLTVVTATGILTITSFTPVLAADGTTIVGGSFGYSYLLTDNTTTHPQSGEDSVFDSFEVIVTDRDGSSATASLDVEIIDDVPAAADEPLQSVAEGATVTGSFDFTAGADGATVTAINGIALVFGPDGFSQEIDIGDGTIKVKADGSYSFTADASVTGTGSASGTFTVTDGDGDSATADFSFTVTDANTPTGGTTSAAVDDDGLVGGNPASTIGDLDANIGDDPADTSEASFTGILALDFGGDGPGSVDFAAMNGQTATIGQELVSFAWNAGTGTLTATGPRGALFTVEITDPTTGAFKVTLLDNVLHAPGGDENDALAALTYTVTDSDGSTATGTLNITFDDDAPTVTAGGAPLPTLTVDESDFSTDATASFASVFTPVFGADGPAAANAVTYTLGINAGATGLVDTATGQTVVLILNGTVVEGRTSGSNALVFTVTVDAAGNVTLDQLRAVVHSPDTGPDQPTSLATANLVTLTATVTDGDGDSASATVNLGGNLVFRDDAPTANPDTNSVGEGAIVTGNVLTDGTDDVFGADGPAAGGGVVGVRAAGGDTTTAVTTGVNTVIQGLYGKLTVQANGSYVYDGDPDTVPPSGATDVFVYTIRDGDGDQSTTTLTITLTDSGLAAANEDATVNEAALPTGSNPPSNAETVSGSVADNVSGGTGPFTFALLSSPTGGYGTITFNPDGSWSYTLATAFTGPTANNGTNTENNVETFTYRVTDANGNTSTNTITIDIIDDVPTARDDANSVGAGSYGPVGGNVLTNDTQGADGAAVSGIASVNNGASDVTADGSGNFQVVGQYGTLTLNLDGTYSYVRAAGTPGGVNDSFTYTLRDGDGDISTATLVISIGDAAPVVGANLLVQIDDDALPGGNPGGVGDGPDAVNTSGTLSGSGGDGPLTFAFQTTGAPAGFTYESDGAGGLLIKQNGTTVVTVTLNTATGAYQVTQVAAISHAPGGDENNQGFTLSYSVTDVDGDSASGTLSIDADDDTSVLGAFQDATIINAVGSVNGTFAYSAGADGFGSFNITGPALTGITYSTVQTATGATLTASTDPDGPGGNPPITVFQLTVRADGTYTFSLVTPEAASTETVSLLGLTAGGPQPFVETPDGRIEFTSPGGINSSTQGFGVANQFVGNGEQFTMEFHTVGTPGNDAPSLNPDFVDAVTLTNNSINGSLTIKWTATNTQTGQTETGTIAVSGTKTLIDPSISFNVLLIEGVGGSGQGVRFASIDISRTILPKDLDLNFQITAVDGDGDVTAVSTLSVFIDAGTPPVVLDLDDDGLEFLPLSHGVAFDYNGDGIATPTAWVGPDDGLLVYDANGDGIVNDGSEIVFSINGSTDLEGLRQRFDTNGDGKLTAADAAFASFGVWQDANSNGVTDPGELRSLSDLGIVSIDLTASGTPYTTASGSVLVSGETHFTRSDGSQGTVGDAAFASSSGRAADEAQRAAAQSTANQAMISSLVAAGLVATIGAAAPAHAAQAGPDSFSTAEITQDDDVVLSRPRGEAREAIDEGRAADHGADASAISGRSGDSAGDPLMFEARIDAGAESHVSGLPQDDGSAASQAGGIDSIIDMSVIPVAAGLDVGGAGFAAAMMAGSQLGAVLADALDAASPHDGIDSLLSGLPHGEPAMGGPMAMAGSDSALFFDPAVSFMHQAVDLSLASHDAVMATAHS